MWHFFLAAYRIFHLTCYLVVESVEELRQLRQRSSAPRSGRHAQSAARPSAKRLHTAAQASDNKAAAHGSSNRYLSGPGTLVSQGLRSQKPIVGFNQVIISGFPNPP